MSRSAHAAPPSETVTVTASALPGTAIDPDKVPVNTQSFTSADLDRLGPASTLRALDQFGVGFSQSNAQGNPFQPNVLYRGFEASPLGGNAQGLAVYANGVRLNQSFGDTVNWDLIPDIAIDRLTLEGANPVFGLNALGGAISVQLKNGFSYQGTNAESSVGSFGLFQESFQFGRMDGNRSLYIAGTKLDDGGWRAHSPSHLANLAMDFGWRGSSGELHLNMIGADTHLTGNGPSPVELLAVNRDAVFTHPDQTKNRFGLANLFGTFSFGDAWSVQGNLYLSAFRQRSLNGDASVASPCDDGSGVLCLDNGSVVTGATGTPIADFLATGTYAQLNQTATDTFAYGGTVQADYQHALFARANALLIGAALDGGHTAFTANSRVGALGADRGFVGPGIVIDQADGSIAPVSIVSNNSYYGFYFTDVFDAAEALSLTVSARYNVARIALSDRIGTALNGAHGFSRLNPAAGVAYKIRADTSFYAGYSEANRAPTPAEFSCADPSAPCSLTNFFVGDPALKQVVAHTFEAGLRGQHAPYEGTSLDWHAGFFHTDGDNDISFVASPIIGRAFFRNIGATLRQGFESSADFHDGPLLFSLDYSYTDATFRSMLTLNSPNNPFADGNGLIRVLPGDRLPSVPAHIVKATISFAVTEAWMLALGGRAASGQILQGDEANLNPKTPDYFVLGLSTRYRISDRLEVFGDIENLLGAKYETFGTFSPTSSIPISEAPGARNPRSLSPAAPFSVRGGIRVSI